MRNFRNSAGGNYNDVMNLGALPQNYYFSGSAAAGSETVDGVMRNRFIGYMGSYTETAGTTVNYHELYGEQTLSTSKTPLVTYVADPDSLTTTAEGINISEYKKRTQYALSQATTRGLNGNNVATVTEKFATKTRQTTGAGDDAVTEVVESRATHTDAGVFSAMRVRLKTPTLRSAFEVETTPTDMPSDDEDSENAANNTTPSKTTGKGATADQAMDSSGRVTAAGKEDAAKPFSYDDELWFASTLKVGPETATDVGGTGDINHAKLVFTVNLPSQVTFYDRQKLLNILDSYNATTEQEAGALPGNTVTTVDGPLALSSLTSARYKATQPTDAQQAAAFERLLTSYEGDDYPFYVEYAHVKYNYTDEKDEDGRLTGRILREPNGMTYEKLTPKQLIERGWTVNIRIQPDYDANNYSASDYGKPDEDDPSDVVRPATKVENADGSWTITDPGSTSKPRSHDGEVIVFELAPPDDARDSEFARHHSQMEAFWDGVKADGCLANGDSITLKLRTRIDNLGSEDTAMEGLVTDGKVANYHAQVNAIRSWVSDKSTAYITTENRDLSFLDRLMGWTHTFEKDTPNPFAGADAQKAADPIYELTKTGEGTWAYTPFTGATFQAGHTYARPIVASDSGYRYGVGDFNNQNPYFYKYGRNVKLSYDAAAYDDAMTGDHIEMVDLDHDNWYEDSTVIERHLTNDAGLFRIRKPSASVRGDTAVLRTEVTSSDFTGVSFADDGHDGGDNQFYLTQAINTGAPVNSFIVDWQVPWWSTGSSTVTDAPFGNSVEGSKKFAIGRVTPSIHSVQSGVWEVPGANKYVLRDSDGTEHEVTANYVEYQDLSGATVDGNNVSECYYTDITPTSASEPVRVYLGFDGEGSPNRFFFLKTHASTGVMSEISTLPSSGGKNMTDAYGKDPAFEAFFYSNTGTAGGAMRARAIVDMVENADGKFVVSLEGADGSKSSVELEHGYIYGEEIPFNPKEEIFYLRYPTKGGATRSARLNLSEDEQYIYTSNDMILDDDNGANKYQARVSIVPEMKTESDGMGGTVTVTVYDYELLSVKLVAGEGEDVDLEKEGIDPDLTDDITGMDPAPLFYITHTTDFANPPSDPQMTYKEVKANQSHEYTPVPGTPEAAEMAEKKALEQKLRVFVYVRVASADVSDFKNGYEEQNGPDCIARENYALPGTDADRDYWYGEDEKLTGDHNTADDAKGTWVLVGEKKGYSVADKTNHVIDLHKEPALGQYGLVSGGYDVRQVRWVVKAADGTAVGAGDDLPAYETPVPHGFRLAVDAMPYDNSSTLTKEATAGIQEADDIDPNRMNTGWEWRKNPDGTYQTREGMTWVKKADGTWSYEMSSDIKVTKAKTFLPVSITQNAAGVSGSAFVVDDPSTETDQGTYGEHAGNPAHNHALRSQTRSTASMLEAPLSALRLMVDESVPAEAAEQIAQGLSSAGTPVTLTLDAADVDLDAEGISLLADEGGDGIIHECDHKKDANGYCVYHHEADGDPNNPESYCAKYHNVHLDTKTNKLVCDEPKCDHDTDPNRDCCKVRPTVGDGDGNASVWSTAAHINHFVSVVPRYDDTKCVETERDRVGFYRDPEYPYLRVYATQAYYNGTGESSYSWNSGKPAIEVDNSRMMRFTITLNNLSKAQLKYLGVGGSPSVDYCTNPQISMLLPFIEGFGAAAGMDVNSFQYIPNSVVDAKTPGDAMNGSGNLSDKWLMGSGVYPDTSHKYQFVDAIGTPGMPGYTPGEIRAVPYNTPGAYEKWEFGNTEVTRAVVYVDRGTDKSGKPYTNLIIGSYINREGKLIRGSVSRLIDPNALEDIKAKVDAGYVLDKDNNPTQATDENGRPLFYTNSEGDYTDENGTLLGPDDEPVPILAKRVYCPLNAKFSSESIRVNAYEMEDDGTISYDVGVELVAGLEGQLDAAGNPINFDDYNVDDDGYLIDKTTGERVIGQKPITKSVTLKSAEAINDAVPVWTYRVAAFDDQLKMKDTLPVSSTTPQLNDPSLYHPVRNADGGMRVEDKIGNVVAVKDEDGNVIKEVAYNRKFVNWRFTGETRQGANGSYTARGRLGMGQGVVIEMLMPIRPDADASIPQELLTTTGFGYKEGNFNGYVPSTQDTTDRISLIRDDRDVNLDGQTDQKQIAHQLTAVGFKSNENIAQKHTSSTILDSLKTKDGDGPAAVPEGTGYTYTMSAVNTGSSEESATGNIWTHFLNVLPYENDTMNIRKQNRNSTWSGWVTDLDSIQLMRFDPKDLANPEGRLIPLDDVSASAWVGPFAISRDGSSITRLSQGPLTYKVDDDGVVTLETGLNDEDHPTVVGITHPTHPLGQNTANQLIQTWMNQKSASDEEMETIGMVNINDLRAYIENNPEQEAELLKGIQFVWAKLLDTKLYLSALGWIRMTVDMRAPLNLPKYNGNITGKPEFDMNLDEDADNADAAARLAEVTQWNSFAQRITRDGIRDTNRSFIETHLAGTFIDAPDKKGYIGDYVWIDPDWNTDQDDTKGKLVGIDGYGRVVTLDRKGNPVYGDDVPLDAFGEPVDPLARVQRKTTYHKAANGRYLPATEKGFTVVDQESEPSRDEFNSMKLYYSYRDDANAACSVSDVYTDVDFDGEPEDPGVNGVLVELLNEYGNPVNRDGVVSVRVCDDKTNNEERWVEGDPVTGLPVLNETESYTAAVAGTPYTFTTESDYYDNDGYYIFSCLEPGNYRLRFTFPDAYKTYALTTKRIGPDADGDGEPDVKMTVDRSNGKLVATSEAFAVEPVAYDPEKFKKGEWDAVHAAYDAAATSFDVGIARPVTYTGVVFRDDMEENPGNPEVPYVEEDPADINGVLDTSGVDLDLADPADAMNSGKPNKELRLANMKVTLFEYEQVINPDTGKVEDRYGWGLDPEDGTLKNGVVPATDADGNSTTTVTGANGYFEWTLVPGKRYVIVAEDTRQRLLKPSVYTWDDSAITYPTITWSAAARRWQTGVWDNDLRLESGIARTKPFTSKVPVDENGVMLLEVPGNADEGYQVQHKFALGWVDGTKGYLGNYIWNDANYDGLQGMSEEGIGGMKVCLEQYWWKPRNYNELRANPNAKPSDYGSWEQVPAAKQPKTTVETTTPSGQYVFKGVSTYVADPEDDTPGKTEDEKLKFLAGYRLRIDRATLATHARDWGVTLHSPFRSSLTGAETRFDEELDSDASTAVANSFFPGNFDMNSGDEYVRYDSTNAVWATFDPTNLKVQVAAGKANGTEGVAYDRAGNAWWFVDRDGNRIAQTTRLGSLLNLRLSADGTRWEWVDENGTARSKAAHAGSYYLNEDGLTVDADVSLNSMIVVAKEIPFGTLPDGVSAETVRTVLTTGPDGRPDGMSYDLADANPIEHWDAGLVEVPRSSVAGRIWNDADYDGVQAKTGDGSYSLAEERPETADPESDAYDPDAADKLAEADGSYSSCEPGLEGQTVLLSQWYWVPEEGGLGGRWEQNTAFGQDLRTAAVPGASVVEGADGASHVAAAVGGGFLAQKTGADGLYEFNELPTAYTAPDGAHYLAAYRVALKETLVDDNGTPDDTADDIHWLLTRYHAEDDVLADADIENAEGNRTPAGIAMQGRELFRGSDGSEQRLVRAHEGQIILADIINEVHTAYNTVTKRELRKDSQVILAAEEVAEGLAALSGFERGVQYDWLRAREGNLGEVDEEGVREGRIVDGGDAGMLEPPVQSIVGVVWTDTNNDGIQNEAPVTDDDGNPVLDAAGEPVMEMEKGKNGIRVTLERYIPNITYAEDGSGEIVSIDGWKKDPAWADETHTWEDYEADNTGGMSLIEGRSQLTANGVDSEGEVTDGVYRFDDLLTQTRDEYDNIIVYAYRVRATDPAFKRNAYMIAKYLRGDDFTLDSNFRLKDALLMKNAETNEEGIDEYDVLLNTYQPGVSNMENVVTAAPSNNDNQDVGLGMKGQVDGATVARALSLAALPLRAAALGEPALESQFDPADGSDRAYNDAGVLDVPMQTISGTLWHDANYNGLLDAGEEPLSGIEVYLKVWIWNDVANKWVRYIPNEGPADPDGIVNDKPVNTTATTDANGYYEFANLPVSAPYDLNNPEDRNLYGYTVEVNNKKPDDDNYSKSTNSLPVTRLLVDSKDGLAPNSKGRRSAMNLEGAEIQAKDPGLGNAETGVNSVRGIYDVDTIPVAFDVFNRVESYDGVEASADTVSVVDGRIVLARPATDGTEDLYREALVTSEGKSLEFDLSEGHDQGDMNAGFGPFNTAVIKGIVWNDENYDGLRNMRTALDGEDYPVDLTALEKPVPGVEVYLTQYYQDPATGKWVQNKSFGSAALYVGNLKATRTTVTVVQPIRGLEYAIRKVGDACSNDQAQWFALPETEDGDNTASAPSRWTSDNRGEFTQVVLADGTVEDIQPVTEYEVIARRVDMRTDADRGYAKDNPKVLTYGTKTEAWTVEYEDKTFEEDPANPDQVIEDTVPRQLAGTVAYTRTDATVSVDVATLQDLAESAPFGFEVALTRTGEEPVAWQSLKLPQVDDPVDMPTTVELKFRNLDANTDYTVAVRKGVDPNPAPKSDVPGGNEDGSGEGGSGVPAAMSEGGGSDGTDGTDGGSGPGDGSGEGDGTGEGDGSGSGSGSGSGDGDGSGSGDGDGSGSGSGEGDGSESENAVLGSFALTTLDVLGSSVNYLPQGSATRQPSRVPMPVGAQVAKSDANGIYTFGKDGVKVPSYVQLDQDNKPVEWGERGVNDEVVLVSYRITVGELGAFAPSRLQVGSPRWMREDSDIERDETGALNLCEQFIENGAVRRDGYVLVSVKADDTDGTQQYGDSFNKVEYDTPYALSVQRGGDAGLKAITRASISGCVWSDSDYDGIRAEGESGIAGVPVELTRYWYDTEASRWIYDEAFNDAEGDLAYERNQLSGEDGTWKFEELEATGTRVRDDEEINVVFGYRVHVLSVPGGYGISPMNCGGNASVDSDLDENTTRLVPDDPVDGLIVLSMNRQDGEPAERVISDGPDGLEWSMAAVHDSECNDTGLVPFSGATISGVVFNDAAKDGRLDGDDERLGGMEVWVERTIMSADDAMDAGWLSRLDDGVAGCDLDVSGEPLEASERYYGSLPTGVAAQLARNHDARDFDVRDKNEGGAEKPGEPEQPGGSGETEAPGEPEQPGEAGGSGKFELPGEPEGGFSLMAALRAAVVALVHEGQVKTAESAVVGNALGAEQLGENAPQPNDPTQPDVPTQPDGPDASDPIAPEPGEEAPYLVYADPDAAQKAQLPLPDRLEEDGILHIGEWERVASTKADDKGAYSFAGLPVADAYGRPYSYRVRMVKPADASYVPFKVGDDRNVDNDYAHLNVLGEMTGEEQGTTEKLDVVTVRPTGANAYGHAFEVLAGRSWTRGAGASVDLGIHIPAEEDSDDWITKIIRRMLPQTGDPLSFVRFFLMLAGASVIVLFASLLRRRRREREDEVAI